MESRASTPAGRLEAMRVLAKRGVHVGVMAAPMILGLNDHEMPKILEAARDAGAGSAGYVPLRLPHQLGALFEDWLAQNYPDRRRRCSTRSGRARRAPQRPAVRLGCAEGIFASICQAFRYDLPPGLNRERRGWSAEHFRRPSARNCASLAVALTSCGRAHIIPECGFHPLSHARLRFCPARVAPRPLHAEDGASPERPVGRSSKPASPLEFAIQPVSAAAAVGPVPLAPRSAWADALSPAAALAAFTDAGKRSVAAGPARLFPVAARRGQPVDRSHSASVGPALVRRS